MGRVPSVSCLHRLHFHRPPPATQVHQGLMYPLHLSQRAGPAGSVSTSGTGSSRGSRSAKGWMTAAMGISQSDASREVLGMFHVDMRMNRGEVLPAVRAAVAEHASQGV